MSEELRAAVREMAQLRREAAVLDEESRYAQEKLRQASMGLPEYGMAKLTDEIATNAKNAASAAEQRVRALTVEAYRATGDKNPTPYTSIRLYKFLVYDRDAVLIWCKANAPTFVIESVDIKRFEKAADSLDGAPVTVEMDPRPTIASDLSGAEGPAD